MNETTSVLPSSATIAPVRSGWRRAVLAFTILGASAYALGRLASHDSSGTIPTIATIMLFMAGPLLALLGFGIWWALFGLGRWTSRLLALVGIGVGTVVVMLAAHPSMYQPIASWGLPLTAGLTGLLLAAVPAIRAWPMAGLIALAALSPWLALRSDGVDGTFEIHTSYRWDKSITEAASERLADRATVKPTGTAAELAPATSADWPGFRGINRTGVAAEAAYRGWDGTKPRERWRNDPVGPAWSSFCTNGEYIYTQEQRGDSESVVCYRAEDGKEFWSRGEPGKHFDQPSGSGPRATPTFSNGRVYAETASGTIVCLNAATSEPIWTMSLVERFSATKPPFGWATSPLVIGDLVLINPASSAAPRLVALDAATGATRWKSEASGEVGYSSPHPATIGGSDQVLIFNGAGVFGHDPQTGGELWHYDWPVPGVDPTSVQPLVLSDGRVIVGGGNVGTGTRCVKVQRDGERWTAVEAWRTTRFTPKFNDFVCVDEHIYGLDDGRLVCFSLAKKAVVWKEGHYDAGQLLLVGDKLLVLSEKGHLACVPARSDEYEELWKMKLADGKAWNHLALARGRLYFRNATVMVAYDLPGWKDKE